MSQIMLIGISGLDADLLRVYGPSLPNLRRLMLESPFLELKSTIPPEPAPSWTSVYTGLNPASHGLLAKMDCLERAISNHRPFQEEFFWERAARAGKRVCVLNPLLAREETIEGLSLVPSISCGIDGSHAQADTFPALLDEPLIPPSGQLTAFCATLRERTEQQVAAALERFARESWDLFFVQLDALDHVQHFLWRYSDPGDPMYPGKNEHANRILDFYLFFDQIVGRFSEATRKDSVLAIVSSHGHERRCIYRLHLNEWLRKQGYLAPLNPAKHLSNPKACEDRQHKLADFWDSIHPVNLLTRLEERMPWSKGQTGKSHTIDQRKTVAQMVELAGATSSYGGIKINRELLEREERSYDLVCEDILQGLRQLRIQKSPVVNWARKREQCYQGKHLDRYPDILFELRSDFGVGRSLYGPLVIPDSTHRLISGTHSSQGVLLLENWPDKLEISDDFHGPTVMDVAPTILRLLDVECPSLDGQALVHPRPLRQLI